MPHASVPAMRVPPRKHDNPLTRSLAGMIGMAFLGLMLLACLGTLPYTLGEARDSANPGAVASPRYNHQIKDHGRLPPWWWGADRGEGGTAGAESGRHDGNAAPDPAASPATRPSPSPPRYFLGSDLLGRSLLIRVLTGGGISLTIGLAAAALSVFLGTLYGAIAGYAGGRTDALMMRAVDVLYGLPYILLVVLLAVASDAVIDEWISRERTRERWVECTQATLAAASLGRPATSEEIRTFASSPAAALDRLSPGDRAGLAPSDTSALTVQDVVAASALRAVPPRELSRRSRTILDLSVLFVAIGGVSWLTMARVVRGQVLSLKAQPFMEAARAMGVPVTGQFLRHLLPNLVGPITVYATLTVPQAILQESFLSFLGIGVRPPLPSWGNLAAEGLNELNPYQSRWWLLLFPCLMLGLTLLALNFVGEGLREALDPKRRR